MVNEGGESDLLEMKLDLTVCLGTLLDIEFVELRDREPRCTWFSSSLPDSLRYLRTNFWSST